MRKIDLQLTFLGPCSVAKNLKNESGAVNHLCLKASFQISLLNRRQWMVNDDKVEVFAGNNTRKFGHLAFAKERRWFGIVDPNYA